MKKFVTLAILAVLCMASCNEKPAYQITGTVVNADLNGNYVYLYPYGPDALPLDSALVENNAFAFKGEQDLPILAMLKFNEDVMETQRVQNGALAPYTALLVLDNNKFKVELSEASTISGTPENDAFYVLQADLRNIRANMEQIMADFRSEDKDVVAAAREKYGEIDLAITSKVKDYILNNTDKQTAAKLLYDFRHTLNEGERREILAKANDTFKAVPGIDKLIDHLAALDKVAIGNKFTDFDMPGLDGKMHKLSEYVGNGKVVLIDFWASWCPPCRADMPHLVELYKQYKNKNFEIVGISLDRTEDAWRKGVKDLNMTWPQLSDIKYWQCEGAAIYGVNSIPHTVLIDKDGTIIANKLRGEELDKKLEELLK